jgi:hypothetical protein
LNAEMLAEERLAIVLSRLQHSGRRRESRPTNRLKKDFWR